MKNAAQFVLSSALLAAPLTIVAQPYPVKPIRTIMTLGAGGSAEAAARAIAHKLTESMGQAVDPMTGKSKWETPYRSPNFSSTLVTGSNLVFTGVMTGEFQAVDADTGKILWSFQTPSGVMGQPVTWERNGKQYVTVMSGIGGVYALRAGDPNLANVPAGASLWTFGLFDK